MRPLLASLALLVSLGVIPPASAEPGGSPQGRRAMALCEKAEDVAEAERDGLLARAVAMAETAVAADPEDAAAHFALFCNLGKQARAAGWSVGNLFTVRRMRRAIDRTHELAPDDPDVLAARGAFLIQLPGLLGGDADEGRRLLQLTLAVDPDNRVALEYLKE